METPPDIVHAPHIAKRVFIPFVVSFAAGWLTRELLAGNLNPANKAAAYILAITLFVMLSVLAVLGTNRWRNNQLTPAAKALLLFSGVFLIVFFILGWRSDL